MKITKQQAAKNRKAIIDMASRAFREKGVEGVSVVEVMKDAGFTIGGFYNHFKSREDLIAQVFKTTFACLAEDFETAMKAEPEKARQVFLERLEEYLSETHRDDLVTGCPIAALVVDASRQGQEVQAAYAEGIRAYLKIFEEQMPPQPGEDCEKRQECAIEVLSTLIGSLILSRAMAKTVPDLSEKFLAVGRRKLKAELS